jgi:hypothetical protein
MKTNNHLSEEDIKLLNTNKGLRALLSQKPYNSSKALRFLKYEDIPKELKAVLEKDCSLNTTENTHQI